jgi:hypothetical protein
MHNQRREHLLAVVEPTNSDRSPLDYAHDHVAGGGTATVLLVLTDETRNDFQQFADSEDLDVGTAESFAVDRLTQIYMSRGGGDDTETLVTNAQRSASDLLDVAAETGSTSIVITQQLAGRAGMRRLVSDSHVPVVVVPAA